MPDPRQMPRRQVPMQSELQPDVAAGPRKRIVVSFDDDTAEARMVRAEVAAKAAMERCWDLEAALRAVDQALADERVPLHHPGAHALTRMPRYGRIRWLGDQRRIAERQLVTALDRVSETQHEVTASVGFAMQQRTDTAQMSVDECIAEVKRGA
jgi:hypothetical protein